MFGLRRVALILPMLLSSSVLAQTAESRLHGEWKLNKEKTLALLLPRAAAEADIKNTLEELMYPEYNLRFRFEPKGIAGINEGGGDEFETFSWRTLKEVSSSKIEIMLSKGDRSTNARVEFLDTDQMRFTYFDGRNSMVLDRGKTARR